MMTWQELFGWVLKWLVAMAVVVVMTVGFAIGLLFLISFVLR